MHARVAANKRKTVKLIQNRGEKQNNGRRSTAAVSGLTECGQGGSPKGKRTRNNADRTLENNHRTPDSWSRVNSPDLDAAARMNKMFSLLV